MCFRSKIYVHDESKLDINPHCTLIYLKLRQYVPTNEVTPSPFKRKEDHSVTHLKIPPDLNGTIELLYFHITYT